MLYPMDGLEELPRRRFTVDEVMRMVEVGILHEDEPVELLEGELVVVSPQGPGHVFSCVELHDRLYEAYRGIGSVREDKPLILSEHSLPEPDIVVARGTNTDYAHRHPEPDDVLLVVEISVTSQRLDRRKLGLYARAGIATVWRIDVPSGRIEAHTDPRPDGTYAVTEVFGRDDTVTPPGTELRLRVRDVLPD